MANDAKKTSQLGIATTLSANDRVVVLTNPSSYAQTQTISLTNVTNSLRYANTSSAGVVKVGDNLSINATGYLNASAGNNQPLLTPNISFTGTISNLPPYWLFALPRKLLDSANGSFLESPNLYWLDQDFDDQYYDLSATESITFENVGGVTGYVDFSDKSSPVLETIDLNGITIIKENLYLSGLTGAFNSFIANNLSYIGGSLELYSNAFDDGPDIAFPSLKFINNDYYLDYNNNGNGLSNTAAPSVTALERVGSSINIYQNNFKSYPNFTNLTFIDWSIYFYNNAGDSGAPYSAPGFPALPKLDGYLQIYGNSDMTSIPAFTSLTTVGYWISFYNNPDLTAFPSFPALTNVNYGGIEAYNCTSMTSVGTFLPSINQIGGDVNFQNCALDEASVDAVLVKLASLDGTGTTSAYVSRNVYLHDGTNAIPSATGLAAKATLEGRGCNVQVNS